MTQSSRGCAPPRSRLRLESAWPSGLLPYFHHTMLWRRSGPVRSLLASHHVPKLKGLSTRSLDPLQILFCGSDEFSIASLRALEKARHDVPNLIDSIDVVHRPAKPTGRGLKSLREGIGIYCLEIEPALTCYSSHQAGGFRRAQTTHPRNRYVHRLDTTGAHEYRHCRLIWLARSPPNSWTCCVWGAQRPSVATS